MDSAVTAAWKLEFHPRMAVRSSTIKDASLSSVRLCRSFACPSAAANLCVCPLRFLLRNADSVSFAVVAANLQSLDATEVPWCS